MKDWNKIGMKQSGEIEKNKSQEQKQEETLNFFRRAFCIDGDARVVLKKDQMDFNISAIVELNDSKRGKFYIGILDRRNLNQEGKKKWIPRQYYI